MSGAVTSEEIDDFAAYGIRAFTTTRAAGTFATSGSEPVGEVMSRWYALWAEVARSVPRLATSSQVHGHRIVVHTNHWEGWLRVEQADGHAVLGRGAAMAVTVADCVPVFLGHPSGAAALLHSGWRGTAARIVEHGVEALAAHGVPPHELTLHLGPAICGRCYEVSPDVYRQLTGRTTTRPATVDLREIIAAHASAAGVRRIGVSPFCTRCDNHRFFSHRAGDIGRQVAVLVSDGT